MKVLKLHGRVLVKIFDNDTQVDSDNYSNTYNLDSYLFNTISDNLVYDNIVDGSELHWENSDDIGFDSVESFIERQQHLWKDLETVENECLDGNDTLVEWLQNELMALAYLLKKEKGEK